MITPYKFEYMAQHGETGMCDPREYREDDVWCCNYHSHAAVDCVIRNAEAGSKTGEWVDDGKKGKE